VREGYFVRKNIEKWKDYQNSRPSDPDQMAHRFTDLIHDLGYARTFYPHSRVTKYLNALAAQTYLSIYRSKKEKRSRIVDFWVTELPLIVRQHHRQILYALLIFVVFSIVGAFSAANDESFVRGVMGDDYVEMTEDNIARGDPFNVYKRMESGYMFVYIAVNNIQVAFAMFALGITFSLGTVWRLFANGIMLGSFQYYFFSKGLGWESVLVIWIHGTLEILSIVVSGAAGMVLGNSMLIPGQLKRMESLRNGARDGVKMMIGLVPIFLIAAFLEGYITRYTSMPVWLSISILAASLAFMVWYFGIYPARLQSRLLSTKPQTRNERP